MTDAALSNTSFTLEDVMREVDKLASDAGNGTMAKPRLAKRVIQWVTEGVIGPDDTKAIYNRFITTEGKKSKDAYTANGLGAKASELKQIAIMATLDVDAIKLISDADRILAEYKAGDVKHKSAYAAYVDIARAQIANKDNGQLSVDDLRDICRKVETNKGDIEKYLEAYKKVRSTFEGSDTQPAEISALLETFGDAIEALGGELPPTKEDAAKARKVASAQAKAAKAQADLAQMLAA
jgi:hypothetical protein